MATYTLWIEDGPHTEEVRIALDAVGQYGGRLETDWESDVLPVLVSPRSLSVGLPIPADSQAAGVDNTERKRIEDVIKSMSAVPTSHQGVPVMSTLQVLTLLRNLLV